MRLDVEEMRPHPNPLPWGEGIPHPSALPEGEGINTMPLLPWGEGWDEGSGALLSSSRASRVALEGAL